MRWSRMNLSEQRRFFRGIVSDRVPNFSLSLSRANFFHPFFFFFISFRASTRPFHRRETSRTNSPHPSAPNRRLIHVATMKEEKCFVPAINNNEIHPVDVPRERYYSVSPFSSCPGRRVLLSCSLFLFASNPPASLLVSPSFSRNGRLRSGERDNGFSEFHRRGSVPRLRIGLWEDDTSHLSYVSPPPPPHPVIYGLRWKSFL